MLAILIVAASLLTQALLFRDAENRVSNLGVNMPAYECASEFAPYPGEDHADLSADVAADVSAGESDSSRTSELASNR